MQNIIDDFEERVGEIDEYLGFLELVSRPNVKIHGCGNPKQISTTAVKTMKAQVFLMLYNLVESSIRGSMNSVYVVMNARNGCLNDFGDFTKNIWINQKIKAIDPYSSSQSSYISLIKAMVNDVITLSPLELDTNQIQISGNLDARQIRKLFESHQIPTATHYRARHGIELKTVKDKRNALSHGDESFSDCGQQYTVESLINIKRQTVIYLRSSLKNVKKYIEQQKYAA